jgi:RNA polymerase sigma-70 factor (ECF subfamily)
LADERNRTTYEQLVLPHVDAAYNMARHIVRDETDAHDIVQDSLLRAWRYFASLRGRTPADCRPWLLQIVRNACWTLLAGRRTQPLPEELAVPDESTPEPSVEHIRRADAQMLRQAVDALPEVYREVILLREIEDLPYKEIAAITGTSIGTVMSRLSRARRQLLSALATDARKGARHDL